MRRICFLLIGMLFARLATAQIDPELLRNTDYNADSLLLNMDAVYNRPLIKPGRLPVALGGYVEANYQYLGQDGVSEGHQFQMRRLTLFVSSAISKRIKFLTEIEFEDGTKEINIEFASIDLEFSPLLNFRGGIVMNPIGAFNQNHDGPKWEFIDRPVSATQMLPATWSNVGFGVFGKKYSNSWVYGYLPMDLMTGSSPTRKTKPFYPPVRKIKTASKKASMEVLYSLLNLQLKKIKWRRSVFPIWEASIINLKKTG